MFDLAPHVRKWIYGIIATTVPLLISLGYLTNEVAAQILNIAAAVLTIGGSALAIKNVPDEE